MTDYADGKAAWLAAGLPSEGEVGDDERIGSLVAPPRPDLPVLTEPGDPTTVRPDERIRALRRRLRERGDAAPRQLHVTTATGRLLGTLETAQLVPRRP